MFFPHVKTFWDMTSCGLIINYQRFGADVYLHSQRGPSRKSSWTT